MYAGCAPQGIGSRHPGNQIPEIAPRSWPTRSLAPGNPGPEKTESSPVPADDRVRSYQQQRLSPIRPNSREGDPKPAVSGSQPGSWALPLHHGQLLWKSQVLQGQFSPPTRGNEKAGDRKPQPEHAKNFRCALGGSQFF